MLPATPLPASHSCKTPQPPLACCLPCLQAYTYVAIWIGLSGAVIMYNKYLLAYRGFPFPITLTMWCVRARGPMAAVPPPPCAAVWLEGAPGCIASPPHCCCLLCISL